MKFIHAADIHLDSPLLGLERYEGAPAEELRGASRQAFENLIRLAIDEGAAFVLIAGDLFDGDWRDYNTGLYFVRQMAELKKQGIAVFIVSGNHDAASQITRALSLPDNVHFFGSRAPETVVVEGLGVAIHGQSYRTPELTDNLAMGYPDGVTGRFNIGLLHTAATGRPGHASYAPCTLDHLLAKGYDYWALGHVHKREELNRAPWVVYAGNTQGRHARETGAKGCTLVTVADGAATAVEHRDLDVVRWAQVQVECSDLDSPRAALTAAVEQLAEATAAAKGRLLATRVEFVGRSRAHSRLLREEEQWRNELRGMCLGSFGDRVWIEKILFRTA
ncbi:MAG: DNA repair exonuclease, partial [Desulfobulbaceae bacterium]|nr:DNA repair exonuclease [Desulfobulbaceae bacterium]